ncbi:MAG TPA: cytochrome c3 family protein [Gemmatimonadales bacterium]|nr:cytochrome c3 family protein [Gemmatimonadales bacterium]
MIRTTRQSAAAAPRAVAAVVWASVPTPQDTVPLHTRVVDTVAVESPLPDPLVPVVQWLFQKPGWVMGGGIVLAAIVAIVAAVVLWRRRGAISHWLATRQRGFKLAMVAGVGLVLAVVAGLGFKSYDYVMHDNDFCRGCHIFVPSGQVAVEKPDTGTYLLVNAIEGKHDTLSCHSCHPFDAKAQTLELVAWITDRPEVVPPHGKVPRAVCEQCHVQGAAKETWQRVATTAGHRTHLESDSLQGKVECLTCHALAAHRFPPADSTCAGREGCHLNEDVKIQLGKMAGQADLHCNTCHQFTADVPRLATFDSATGSLRPGSKECFSCHAMRAQLAEFDPAREPHGGACGMCHNPHTDVKPEAAHKSCADAQCHAEWRDVAFHVGAAHRRVGERCQTCHDPHAARVDASNCTGCHNMVRQRPGPGRLRIPERFDTAKALRTSAAPAPPPDPEPRGKGDAPPVEVAPTALDTLGPGIARDSFSHRQHRKLKCVTCHDVESKSNALTFEAPRGCLICHHQAPDKRDCAACHTPDEVRTLSHGEVIRVAVERAPTRARGVTFDHESHKSLRCRECHVEPVTLATAADTKSCVSCHDAHHEAGGNCAACHMPQPNREAHTRASHVRCSACHESATVARLSPTRSFCLGCHEPAVDHYRDRECTVCHMLSSPEAIRPALGRTR